MDAHDYAAQTQAAADSQYSSDLQDKLDDLRRIGTNDQQIQQRQECNSEHSDFNKDILDHIECDNESQVTFNL
jgi:hypothetical protein